MATGTPTWKSTYIILFASVTQNTGCRNQQWFGEYLSRWGVSYPFNPKEQTTLRGDNDDGGDRIGNIGNLFLQDSSTGAFSPALYFQTVPEPTAALLAALAAASPARLVCAQDGADDLESGPFGCRKSLLWAQSV